MESAYSISQSSNYFNSLLLLSQYKDFIGSPKSFPKTEEALAVLFQCQITRFSYDNFSVFYSEKRPVDLLSINSIYTKFFKSELEGIEPSGPVHLAQGIALNLAICLTYSSFM